MNTRLNGGGAGKRKIATKEMEEKGSVAELGLLGEMKLISSPLGSPDSERNKRMPC
jgi:hypothetical protein